MTDQREKPVQMHSSEVSQLRAELTETTDLLRRSDDENEVLRQFICDLINLWDEGRVAIREQTDLEIMSRARGLIDD